MIRTLRKVPVALTAILLVLCLIAYYMTRDSASPASAANSAAPEQPLVDTGLLQTAVSLAALAATPGEQAEARQAWSLADHELDLRYAWEIRRAEAEGAAPAKGPLRQLNERIAQLQAQVDADKKRTDDLSKDTSGALAHAQAQLDLDQDELDDAQQDLTRAGGDKRATLQRLLEEHQTSDKVADQSMRFGSLTPAGTLSQQLRAWSALRDYDRRLRAAGEQAASQSRMLLDRHNRLRSQQQGPPDPSASAAVLRQMAARQKIITGLDQRVDDTKQLAAVYQRWSALVNSRERSVLHLIWGSLTAILVVLLTVFLLNSVVGGVFFQTDRRRLHQVRMIARISLQVTAALLILLIVFGRPTQLTTMIGLITAGITVVMKDFIVAFLGWFTLMGKNGVSVGDWVEIEGVSGEVVEIGLLKTMLLELGNWTETGHPTGRTVSFSNSFAMEGHYFNFSTSGQWLWDELQITLPMTGDPYAIAQQIREMVEKETQGDAAEAARDWERVTHQYGAPELSMGAQVNLRPAVAGLEVLVRYITRAPRRNAVKSKLFQSIVDLLRKSA